MTRALAAAPSNITSLARDPATGHLYWVAGGQVGGSDSVTGPGLAVLWVHGCLLVAGPGLLSLHCYPAPPQQLHTPLLLHPTSLAYCKHTNTLYIGNTRPSM